MKTHPLLVPILGMLLSAAPAPAQTVVDDLTVATPADSHHTSPDTTAHGDRWLSHDLLLRPGQPCALQEIVLLVRGFTPTPCDSFLGVAQVPGQPITIRTLHRPLLDCPPTIVPHFYAVPVPLGQLAAGFHSVVIRRRQLLQTGGSIDSVSTDTTYSFTVVSDCPPGPGLIYVSDLPHVDRATTVPARPCPDQPVALQLNGHFPDGCGRLESSWVAGPGYVYLVLAPYPPAPVGCPEYLKPWEAKFPLGNIPSGYHNVVIDQTVRGTNSFWPPIPDEQHRGLFQFLVSEPCDSVPHPPVAYIQNIHIGPVDGAGPICPSDSIRVDISGQFPGECCALKRIELHPSPIAGPMPEPPIVRVVVDWDTPVLCLCASEQPEPWSGSVILPPLPTRNYGLIVELLERGGGRDSTLTSTIVPFQVASAESCGVVQDCLWAGWAHQGPYGSCDAYVGYEREATVTFMVKTPVPLSGLQGVLRTWERGLRITAIEPVGVASGMRLTWVREPYGARFVLFAEQGAPIPAGEAQPILAVRAVVEGVVSIPEDPPPPPPGPVFHLGADQLLGADQNGQGVYECLPPPWARLAPEVAVLCVEQPCDFNADGASDVRDVVLMVRCALHNGPCPPQVVPDFDCDQSGVFDVSDVICCAMHMLRSPGCPTCPPDSVRAEPDIAIRFGAPQRLADGFDVPLLIDGAHKIGAARLRLRFPADRFTLEMEDHFLSSGLFAIHQVEGDELILGLIGGFAIPLADLPLPSALHLKLRPGQTHGGEVRLLGGEISGPDGILLDVDLDIPAAPLTGEGFQLTAPVPNPFSSATRFSVHLDAPARLDVAIFDLSGRRVAGLFQGNRAAGPQEFSWDGHADDGGRAANGIYFLSVRIDDRLMRRKLVLVRR